MKILFIYPEYKNICWNLKKVLKVPGRKAAYPPVENFLSLKVDEI